MKTMIKFREATKSQAAGIAQRLLEATKEKGDKMGFFILSV